MCEFTSVVASLHFNWITPSLPLITQQTCPWQLISSHHSTSSGPDLWREEGQPLEPTLLLCLPPETLHRSFHQCYLLPPLSLLSSLVPFTELFNLFAACSFTVMSPSIPPFLLTRDCTYITLHSPTLHTVID